MTLINGILKQIWRHEMKLIIIAAVSENNVIGRGGIIPWHIPEDLKRFRKLTLGYPVIMGRNTYESVPERFRPLPNRTNVVITSRSMDENAISVKSPVEAITSAMELKHDKAYIIGGEKVYNDFMLFADRLEITKIKGNYLGDKFFPRINPRIWERIHEESHGNFLFETYVRR